MDIVSYETAKALRAAGFPQPAQMDEQFWYNTHGYIVCYGHTTDSWGELYEGADCFAPTADDILRHLPDYALGYSPEYSPIHFCAYKTSHPEIPVFVGENAAELLAKCWLHLRGVIL